MTAGDYGDTPAPSADGSTATRQASRAPSMASTTEGARQNDRSMEMPPPAIPNPRRTNRKLGQNKNAPPKQDHDSLFVPAEEDDARWDPPDYEEEEETMGWDASIQPVGLLDDPFDASLTPFRMLASSRHSETLSSCLETTR